MNLCNNRSIKEHLLKTVKKKRVYILKFVNVCMRLRKQKWKEHACLKNNVNGN